MLRKFLRVVCICALLLVVVIGLPIGLFIGPYVWPPIYDYLYVFDYDLSECPALLADLDSKATEPDLAIEEGHDAKTGLAWRTFSVSTRFRPLSNSRNRVSWWGNDRVVFRALVEGAPRKCNAFYVVNLETRALEYFDDANATRSRNSFCFNDGKIRFRRDPINLPSKFSYSISEGGILDYRTCKLRDVPKLVHDGKSSGPSVFLNEGDGYLRTRDSSLFRGDPVLYFADASSQGVEITTSNGPRWEMLPWYHTFKDAYFISDVYYDESAIGNLYAEELATWRTGCNVIRWLQRDGQIDESCLKTPPGYPVWINNRFSQFNIQPTRKGYLAVTRIQSDPNSSNFRGAGIVIDGEQSTVVFRGGRLLFKKHSQHVSPDGCKIAAPNLQADFNEFGELAGRPTYNLVVIDLCLKP